jgi:dTDP-4-amino-4,6-dideoxygalactose transaminase
VIPLTRPRLGEAEAQGLQRVLASGWLTQGKEVAAFEAAFAQVTGAPYACAVANCTAALHLALLAVGVGAGDEVITVSHSFIATANAIHMCGARPVFADILPGTFNIDPEAIPPLIGPRTRAILCVHQMGMPCDLAAIGAIARAHGLALVEDAACAIGSAIRLDGRWVKIGSPLSDAACFSFHPRKVLTTGEGGMITTARAAIDARCRTLRQHAMSLSDLARHSAARVMTETYAEPGFNYRMTDLQASIGTPQLARLGDTVAERRALAASYATLLAAMEGVVPPAEPDWARTNWQSYCVGLPAGADRDAVMQAMLDRGVATRRAIMCSHLEPAWQAARRGDLRHAEAASRTHLLLPLFNGMTRAEQSAVAEALSASLAGVS